MYQMHIHVHVYGRPRDPTHILQQSFSPVSFPNSPTLLCGLPVDISCAHKREVTYRNFLLNIFYITVNRRRRFKGRYLWGFQKFVPPFTSHLRLEYQLLFGKMSLFSSPWGGTKTRLERAAEIKPTVIFSSSPLNLIHVKCVLNTSGELLHFFCSLDHLFLLSGSFPAR